MNKLSKAHRLFVEAYDGDLPSAMRIAGYSGADNYLTYKGNGLMNEPLIVEAIRERSRYINALKTTIASREERQKLWSDIMRNEDRYQKEEVDSNNVPIKMSPNIPLPTRLKASELLGKSEADFIDKIDITAQVTVTDLIKKSYIDDGRTIEDIEAEYYLLKDKKQVPVIELNPSESDCAETPHYTPIEGMDYLI